MSIKLGVVMDPISSIKVVKDSTFAMLLEAQKRGWQLFYMEQQDLFMRDGTAYTRPRRLQVKDDVKDWFKLEALEEVELSELDILLMRKDPPFDMEFVMTTYFLERAEEAGVLVVNRPQGLRDASEKAFTAWFPQCCPPTLIARSASKIRAFLQEQGQIVLKPMDSMGGQSIFRMEHGNDNTNVIIETVTRLESRFVMAQKYIPEIATGGDKRILLIDGEPIPYALARMPPADDFRGNLAVGGKGVGRELSERDRWICEQVGPALREMRLYFVGIDVIGDYLTEVNVTSPTGIRELDRAFDLNISATLMDCLEKKLQSRRATGSSETFAG